QQFEALVRKDPRFELVCPTVLGLVCFRVKVVRDENAFNKRLLQRLNKDGDIHLVASEARGVYFLRVAVCSRFTESEDMEFAWRTIERTTSVMLAEEQRAE
ncbi:aromatic-L-amino-acid decarboxylase, partial [Hyalella azteca]|uniref:Aromatic-L-amino-acid decarboxylase n=1 Tax=Hyalella azteca TaxID=294128 RepID=A0A8B7PKF6_HYAAZ